MSVSDLPQEINVEFDVQHMGWWCFIPLTALRRHPGVKSAMPDKEEVAGIAVKLARIIAQPGPIQREARKQITRNNKRRFGHD